MTTATMSSQSVVDTKLAEAMAGALAEAAEKVEVLTAEQLSNWNRGCDFLRSLNKQARQSIEEVLCQGVDAKAFVAGFEGELAALSRVASITGRVLTIARNSPLPPEGEEFVANYRALLDEVLSLHQFLADAVAKAKAPRRSIDWQRVHEVEAAYARGETKPFQPSSKG
jgi:hypothetical protein